MGFIIVISAAFLCTVPSSLIAQQLMRARGQRLGLIEAPQELMKVAPAWQKVLLIGLNCAVLGTAIWLLARD